MDSTLIKNVTVICYGEGEVLENTNVAIKDGKIADIGNDFSTNSSNYSKVIDGEDGFLLPGFIDAHVHLMAKGFLNEDYMNDPLSYYFYRALDTMKITLEGGVTTARDCGLADIGLKRAVEKKLFPSPKLQISVIPLSITGGHFDITLKSGHDMIPTYPGFPHPVCDGVESVIAKTREVIRAGADFVKVMATGGVISANDAPQDIQFSLSELKAIVSEAERIGKRKVATHCHGLGGLELSLKAGVHSIEHGTSVTKELANIMIDKGTFLIPTFSVIKWQKYQGENKLLDDDKNEKALEVAKIHRENIEMAYNQGVTIAMGTDSGVLEHGKNLKELEYLVEMGMSPLESIIAGTSTSAKCLGIQDSTGSVEIGKAADLVLTDKNPLDNISILGERNNILMVFQDGDIVKNLL